MNVNERFTNKNEAKSVEGEGYTKKGGRGGLGHFLFNFYKVYHFYI